MPLVELYLAKSFEDLEKYVTVPEMKSAKLMCNSAARLYMEAERYFVMGDHERSYVLFGKYFKTILPLKKRDDYRRQKAELDAILGPQSKQIRAIDIMSELRDNLVVRYEQLHAKDTALKIPTEVDRMPISNPSDETHSKSIKSCFELRQDLQANRQILLIDCRSTDDYEKSRLRSDNLVLHIPEERLQLGMTAWKVGALLETERDRALWAGRAERQEIVLMDWSTQSPESATRGSSLWIIKDIMLNWDPEIEYRSVLILEGGYENYILMYPMDCTNPNIRAPMASDLRGGEDENGHLDDIEYPNLSDITMKDQSSSIYDYDNRNNYPSTAGTVPSARGGPPTVDRSSKLAALKNYNSRKDLLKEQHDIAERLLANEKECLNAELELAERIKSGEKERRELANVPKIHTDPHSDHDDDHDEEEKEDRINESRFRIMQLDNSIEDAMLKKQLVEEKKAVVPPERDSQEAQDNLRIVASIRRKEQEFQEIRAQRERVAQEREEKLRLAKEQKKNLKRDIYKPPVAVTPPVVAPPTQTQQHQVVNVPRQPVVDRSVKPTVIPAAVWEDNVKRDFAPVFGAVGRGLTGLKNLGNTCYMNSILQCLSNTSPLVEYFVTDMYRKHINVGNKTQGRVAKEVAALIRELWTGQCKYIASKDLRYVVGQYEQTFRGVDQQDSHEFLTILVDLMHSDLQTLTSTVLQSTTGPLKLPPSDRSWLEHTKNRESNIFRLFYGQIKSTIKCRVCLKESATYDCFSNLSLELPPERSGRCSVYQCFDMYFHGEGIEDWDCPSCKEKRAAVKKLDVSKLPPVLVVHLKRFYADPSSNSYRKKTLFVDFPVNTLDISEYVANSEKRRHSATSPLNTTYNLYAISNHYGSMESGHYTAYCRNNLLGDWYKYDDHTVSRMDKSDVVSSGAYILFYTNLPDTPLPLFKAS